jgi:hypothetical protein
MLTIHLYFSQQQKTVTIVTSRQHRKIEKKEKQTNMSTTKTDSLAVNTFSARSSIVSLLIINIAIPYACYTILKNNHASDVIALSVSAIAPALASLISVLRSRQINIISLFTLGGLVIGLAATFIGGDTHVLLLRESLFTGVLGIACFVSLLFPRPLMFLAGRSLIAGNDPAHIARYNQLWQNPSARRTSRFMTIVWGFIYSSDFLLRLLLIYTLPIATVIVVGPLLTGVLIGGSILWTFAYLRRARQHVRAVQADTAELATAHN